MPDCPQCSLINPPGAETCDCGHSFTGAPFRSARLPQVEVKTFTYVKRFGMNMLDSWNTKPMDEHAAERMQGGWELMNSGADSGHVNVGRTVTAAALTGGLSLLFVASRSRDYVRRGSLTFNGEPGILRLVAKWSVFCANDILTYTEMCLREATSLQRGMNFNLHPTHSVILMSVRPGAPYQDRFEDDGMVIVYEGARSAQEFKRFDPEAYRPTDHAAIR